MKKLLLLFLSFVLSTNAWPAYPNYTVKSSGGDFNTLQGAVNDLITNHSASTTAVTITISDPIQDTTPVALTTTVSATSIIISTSGAARNNTGIWSTSYYTLIASGSGIGIFTNTGNILTLDGLQIYNTFTGGSGSESAFLDNSTTNNNTVTIKNSILRGGRYTIRLDGGSTALTVKIYNTLAYTATVGAIEISMDTAGEAVNLYNDDFISTGLYGIRKIGVNNTTIAENCYAYSATGSAYVSAGGTFTLITTASNDTTGSVGLQNIAYSTVNFTNVTANSENLNLIANSALIGSGTNLSGTFTTDITGATRTVPWDVGAFKSTISIANNPVLTINSGSSNVTITKGSSNIFVQ